MRMRQKLKMPLIAVCLCLTGAGTANAQWVVSDPGNLAQSIINSAKEMVETAGTKANTLNGFLETKKVFEQGKKYYDALKSVHDVVKGGVKVTKSIGLVMEISEIYVENYQKMLSDENYTPDELAAISSGYAMLIDESSDVLQDLKNVVNVTGMSLSDAERLAKGTGRLWESSTTFTRYSFRSSQHPIRPRRPFPPDIFHLAVLRHDIINFGKRGDMEIACRAQLGGCGEDDTLSTLLQHTAFDECFLTVGGGQSLLRMQVAHAHDDPIRINGLQHLEHGYAHRHLRGREDLAAQHHQFHIRVGGQFGGNRQAVGIDREMLVGWQAAHHFEVRCAAVNQYHVVLLEQRHELGSHFLLRAQRRVQPLIETDGDVRPGNGSPVYFRQQPLIFQFYQVAPQRVVRYMKRTAQIRHINPVVRIYTVDDVLMSFFFQHNSACLGCIFPQIYVISTGKEENGC